MVPKREILSREIFFFVSFVRSVHSEFAQRDFGYMKFGESSCLVKAKLSVMFVLFLYLLFALLKYSLA